MVEKEGPGTGTGRGDGRKKEFDINIKIRKYQWKQIIKNQSEKVAMNVVNASAIFLQPANKIQKSTHEINTEKCRAANPKTQTKQNSR